MITSKVTSKGQVTIPKEIRKHIRAEPSDKIVFIPLEDGNVLITRHQASVSDLFGMLKHRKKEKPVSLQEIESAIAKKRLERASK
ncbi:MAG: type II toxin-antitoxin system PrlF family antitoxin [Desulfatitalea sp.]